MKGTKLLSILVMGFILASCGSDSSDSGVEVSEAFAQYITADNGVPIQDDLVLNDTTYSYVASNYETKIRIDKNGTYMLYSTDGSIDMEDEDRIIDPVTGNWRWENNKFVFDGLGDSIEADFDSSTINYSSLSYQNSTWLTAVSYADIDTNLANDCLPVYIDETMNITISSDYYSSQYIQPSSSAYVSLVGDQFVSFCK